MGTWEIEIEEEHKLNLDWCELWAEGDKDGREMGRKTEGEGEGLKGENGGCGRKMRKMRRKR